MHYVHCIFCDHTYSADGNPHYVTDCGDMLCDSCIDETVEVEKRKVGDEFIYTVRNDWVSEHHEYVCDNIEDDLRHHSVDYTRESCKEDSIDWFRITEQEVLVKTLEGVKIKELFYL